MFNSLKNKLKSWLGKPEEKGKKTKKSRNKETKNDSRVKKEKSEIKVKSEKRQIKSKKIPSDKELRKQVEGIKKQIPQKFSSSELKYIPDLETIQNQDKKRFEKEIEDKKPGKKSFFSKLFNPKESKEPNKIEGKSKKDYEPLEDEPLEDEKSENKDSFFFRFLKGKSKISKEDIESIFEDLEIILLENNVSLSVVDKIKESLAEKLIDKEVKKGEIENEILISLNESISSVLIDPPNLLETIKKHSGIYTIIFFGINGSGKTTSIAKLANKLEKSGISCVLGAGDTFRAASIEQLKIHGESLKVPVIAHAYGSDPAAVAFDAKSYASKHGIKCVLIDTAGRMYTKDNLIREMEKIIRVTEPDLKIFVAESITGNDAVQQAQTFNEAIGIDGIILTKADVDEKGGVALSVSYITGKPIYFLGTGQSYEDLKDFKKSDIIKSLGLDL